MRTSDPKPIGTVLGSVLEELGLGTRIKQLKVLDLWAEVVGEQIAKVTSAERINNGKLVVRVNKAPWRTELVFMKKEILAKLNRTLGEGMITDIIFR